MHISRYDFELPEELIAQEPTERRGDSRMFVLDRAAQTFADCRFNDFPNFLSAEDVLVINNTKVFPARLTGTKESPAGAHIEIFLVNEINAAENIWECLARPAKRLKIGTKIVFAKNDVFAEVLEKNDEGRVRIAFRNTENFSAALEKIGQTPLPPYIKRDAETSPRDRERYQTVFAKERGAVAAPTAGLHFTEDIFERIKQRGAAVCEVTLHVGYGTFEPVRVEDLSEHRVAPERAFISAETAEILNKAKREKKRIIAIGTTTTRTLESFTNDRGIVESGARAADLTITPDYKFRFVDALVTNFHLPQSSLLVLTATFGGREFVLEAYRRAVSEKYRFYSYGDCMFIK